MSLNRRHFLLFLGATAATAACADLRPSGQAPMTAKTGFQAVTGPIPLPTMGLDPAQQKAQFATYTVTDDLVLPEGYAYQVMAAWGDPVGDSRFGYNNDYLALIETGENEGLLVVNFEYISAVPWQQTFESVIGKKLPFREADAAVREAIKAVRGDQVPGLDASSLPPDSPLREKVVAIAREGLIDQGIGVIALKRNDAGRWERVPSPVERRITGISGLEDQRYVKATGPAVAVFQKTSGKGYIDNLGANIIGTMQNCAGGTTPWGTVFSAEENFQGQVPEPVHPDGTAFHPIAVPFNLTEYELTGLGNVFGLAGNKYGWMVEVDPANPDDFGTKHTWLGRYRHEAVGVRAAAGQPVAVYSGCDRRGGHLYKFVSAGTVTDPTDKANSKLFQAGMLYAARFHPDGTGTWLPLKPETPIDPVMPSHLAGQMVPLPLRPGAGFVPVKADAIAAEFKQRFQTLADLYEGEGEALQGAILIDAHFAGNAIGATCTARPEDTDIAPDGSLYITFTSGGISRADGSPDTRIFQGPNGDPDYEHGWIMHLTEDGNDPAAMTFKWEMIATGGEPVTGGMGFSNPDNLAFDPQGNLWFVTDMSTDKLNQAVPANRVRPNGKPLNQSNLRGIFGNNTIWYLPLQGANAGQAQLFGIGPMECETTGPWFTQDNKTLFLAVQHPGEVYGTRQDMQTETRDYELRTTTGDAFMQKREVPLGSNWPGKTANDPPKPAVVMIYRTDDQPLTSA